jgi:hypothetical protein
MRNAVLSKSNNLVLYSNVSSIAEWFRNHSPMLENPKGFYPFGMSTYEWRDMSEVADGVYAIPANLDLLFGVYFSDGSQWKIGPPHLLTCKM